MLYVLLGVWLAIAAFAITIFASVAHDQIASAAVAPFAAAAVYTLVVIGYLLYRQWHRLERDLRSAEVRAVVAEEESRAQRGQTVKVTTPSPDGRDPQVAFYYVAEPDPVKAELIIKRTRATLDEQVETVGPLPKTVIIALRLKPGEVVHG